MRVPDFLIIGAMKAGTTALHVQLDRHPDVWLPDGETDWFAVASPPEELEAALAPAPAEAVVGFDSPNCTKWPASEGVPERIAAHAPEARMVYLLRHPIERMRSHWLHRAAEGLVREPAAEALVRYDAYLQASSYGAQLARFLEVFDRDRILVLRSEDLRADTHGVAQQVCAFLGVDPSRLGRLDDATVHASDAKTVARPGLWALHGAIEDGRVPRALRGPLRRVATRRASADAAALPAGVEAELVARLQPDLARLVELVGGDFDAWGLLDR